MWYKKLGSTMVLRSDEPAETGSGVDGVELQDDSMQDAAPDTAQDTAQDAVDPWDFSAEEAEEADDAEGSPAPDTEDDAEPEAEYVLEFGKYYSGSDETTARITAIAKESGLDAKGFSKALQGITEYLVEQKEQVRSAGLEELKSAWKGDFDKNMKQVRGVLRGAFSGQELSADRKAALQSADVFKLVHYLASRGGEQSAAVGRSAPAMSPKQMADDMLNNPDNPLREALLNPSHAKHKYAAEKYNKLFGVRVFG